ncbi:MAG: hypothetical protein GY756_02415 [bacterium]|nr:hypothetical protein [bacterium]
MKLDYEKIKQLMMQEFTEELCQKINELCLYRIHKTKEYKEEVGDEFIDNWPGHKSRDDLDNKAQVDLKEFGITHKRKIRSCGYKYNEFHTESFIFIQKMMASSNSIDSDSDLVNKYTVRETIPSLFPEYDDDGGNHRGKYPCFLVYEKESFKSELKYVKISMRNKDGWIEDLVFNIYPKFGLADENIFNIETPNKEDVPPAAELFEQNIDEDAEKDAK